MNNDIHPRHLAKPAVFVAQPIQNFVILGVPFEAYLDENGEVIFSEIGVERGFDIATGGMNKIRKTKIYREQYLAPISGSETTAQEGFHNGQA